MASRNQRKKRNNKKKEVAARSEYVRATEPSADGRPAVRRRSPRSSTETKSALRTTELAAYVLTVLAIVITALALDADVDGGRDPFGAGPALRYITYLTVGYLIARGLAKAGSWNLAGRSRSDDHDRSGDHHRSSAVDAVEPRHDEPVDVVTAHYADDHQHPDDAAGRRVDEPTQHVVAETSSPSHDDDATRSVDLTHDAAHAADDRSGAPSGDTAARVERAN